MGRKRPESHVALCLKEGCYRASQLGTGKERPLQPCSEPGLGTDDHGLHCRAVQSAPILSPWLPPKASGQHRKKSATLVSVTRDLEEQWQR